MKRTTIMLPDDLRESARRLAAERGVSMGEFMREAIQEKVQAQRPKPNLGIFDSGRTDISARIGEEGFEPKPWR